MIPNINVNGRIISPYLLAAVAGALLVAFVAYRLAKKRSLDEEVMVMALLISMVGIFIGGSFLYGVTNLPLLIKIAKSIGKVDAKTLLQGLLIAFGGLVYYGGLFGGLLAGYIYLRCKKVPLAGYGDIAAVSIPLFHFFGRLGCFLSGCCYGIESSVGFIMHHSHAPGANGVRRFPVQLAEAAVNLIIFALLLYLHKKGRAQGRLLSLYLLAYPLCRFFLEFLRGDAYRGFVFGLSTSQLISLVILAANLTYLIKRKKLVTR